MDRMLAADRTRRIPAHLEFAELHLQSVEMNQPPDQRLADADDQLHRFDGLHHADDSRQHAEHAAFGAARHHPGRRRFGIEAAIARPAQARRKNRALAFKPEDRAVDVRLVEEDTNIVGEIAGREIVGAVDDDIVVFDDLDGVVAAEHGVVKDDMDVGIDILDAIARAIELLASHVLRAVQDLALEIRIVDNVEIDQPKCADAGRGQVKRDRRSEPASANAKHLGRLELFLPLQRYLRHDEMPRITGNFIIAKLDVLESHRIQNALAHIKNRHGLNCQF